MKADHKVDAFLSQYNDEVVTHALILRDILSANLPGITEQVDIPAKMIGYCYGQKHTEMICTMIPSKKGLKLGFNKGVDLPDPEKMLEGTGKISRYVEIRSEKQIRSAALKKLIAGALRMYKERITTKK